MLKRRKWISKRSLLLFAALATGFFASRMVFSQTPAPSTPAAPAATAPAAAAPASFPDYFDAHATDTNGDGKVDDKDTSKWPDATGGAAGVWITPAYSVDASGKSTGGELPSSLTPSDMYDRIAHNMFSINFVWTLVTGFLVMFMQAGFAMVEGGLCRSKNSAHTFAMNFMIYPLGCIGFYVYGFALGWGNWYNGPVRTGWYASLGPGTSVLNQGIGIGGDPSNSWRFQVWNRRYQRLLSSRCRRC